MRVFATTALLGLVLSSASCPGFGSRGERAASFTVNVTAGFDEYLVEDVPADVEEENVPDPEPIAAVAKEPTDVWGGGSRAAEEDDDPAALARIEKEKQAAAEQQKPRLASIAKETWIYDAPKRKARRIGYLRAGAVVARSQKPVSYVGCKGGFYKIEPRGYVCLGKFASLDVAHPVVAASRTRPSREGGLPYNYVMGRIPTPPFYSRVPTPGQQAFAESDLAHWKKKLKTIERDPKFVPLPDPEEMPAALVGGKGLPGLADDKRRGADLVLGHARIRSGFALLSQFESEDRRFGLTTDLHVIPLDRTRWVAPATFAGVSLGEELTLPIAFVMKKRATSFERNDTGKFETAEPLKHRQALGLTGGKERGYLETKDGSWVRAEDVRIIETMSRVPTWAREGRKWIDVSILEQSLVAYEGMKPVYVTLVSTGADGLGDPKKTHSTIQGVFLIHTKHVTTTMDGDEAGDEFDLRDVPFVQYFTEGYALHAAYWHDDFGTPRSHGCVNLAPVDAAWLFEWTTPEVPANWHGALSLKKGTLVYTHP